MRNLSNFGDTYKSGNVNGTQILYFDRVENGKVYFVRHAYNTIVANKPFLIKPSKDVESISTAAATEYPYVTIEATKNEMVNLTIGVLAMAIHGLQATATI